MHVYDRVCLKLVYSYEWIFFDGNIEIGRYDLWVLITEKRERGIERQAKEKIYAKHLFIEK